MSKAQKVVKHTNIQQPNSSGHQIEHSETVDDNLLPDAIEIQRLHQIDPNILDWLKCRAEKEQDFRHKAYNDKMAVLHKNEGNNRTLNTMGLIAAFLIFTLGLLLAYFLVIGGYTITASIFTGVVLISAASLFITRKPNNNSNKSIIK
jgi:uncharacterized membrane protein